MEFIVPGICGLLVILGLVAIVMSRTTWRIPMLILMFFILIGSLGLFFMSAKTLRTRENWEDAVAAYRAKIKIAEDGEVRQNQVVQKGIEQLTAERRRLDEEVTAAMAERGRVWRDAIRDRVDLDGTITATFDQWPPEGLEPKSTVFVFEEKDVEKGGKYLGEFTVRDIDKQRKDVKLSPSNTMVQRELNLISASKGPWVFYEIMPIDSRTLFAEKDRNELKALLPPSTVEQYEHDQRPAKPGDPEDDVRVQVKFVKEWPAAGAAAGAAKGPVAGALGAPAANPAAGNPAGNPAAAKTADDGSFKPGDVTYLSPDLAKELVEKKIADYDTSDPAKAKIYVRPLRDYATLFRATYRRRNELYALQAEVKQQADQVEGAVTEVKQDLASAEAKKAGLSKDLAKFQAELASVVAFNQSLDAEYSKTRAALSELFRSNLRLSAQLASVRQQIVNAIAQQRPPAEASASVER